MAVDRIEVLEQEVQRLEGLIVSLEKRWAKRYLLFLFALTAIPAYFLFGGVVAVVTFFSAPALVAAETYLLYFRRKETLELIVETKQELDYLLRQRAAKQKAKAEGDAKGEGDAKA